jgi:LPXTG-motif cell wall-anchored protein
MTKRILSICLLLLVSISMLHAQSNEGVVDVVLDRDTVRPNSLINADVFLQADYIAGADVTIEVDTTCLRIENLLAGEYLPTTIEDGGFSPYQEFNDSQARLAANVTNTDKITSERGRFFRAQIRAICDAPADAVITVSNAELVNDRLELLEPSPSSVTVFIRNEAPSDPVSDNSTLLMLIIGGGGFAVILLLLLFFWYRKRKQDE